jgi:hypothetical protein
VNMFLTIIRLLFSEVFICSVLLNLFNILRMFNIFEQHGRRLRSKSSPFRTGGLPAHRSRIRIPL